MWSGEVSINDLHNRSCWKVEFFCGESLYQPRTAYPLEPIGSLLDERRETINPQGQPDKLINYVGLENVQSITGNLVDFAPRYGKEIKSRSKVFQAGDVLYGRLRPYLNKVYVADGLVSEGICSGEFYVLVPKSHLIMPQFLRAMLSSSYVHQFVSRFQTGSALPRLQLHDLLAIEVPLPPLQAQSAFEQFLISQSSYQRQLAAELAELPQRTLDMFTHALETGIAPRLER